MLEGIKKIEEKEKEEDDKCQHKFKWIVYFIIPTCTKMPNKQVLAQWMPNKQVLAQWWIGVWLIVMIMVLKFGKTTQSNLIN